jgi:lipopolysaccharide biosynthesis protein
MTATRSRRTIKKEPEEKKPSLPTHITEQEVLQRLGKPADLRSVDVHRYDASRCRVNVRREMDKAAAEEYYKEQGVKTTERKKLLDNMEHSFTKTITLITDSFYLRTNYDGSLRKDNKPIQRRY